MNYCRAHVKITVVTQLCNTCLDFSCLVTLVVKTHTVAFSVYFLQQSNKVLHSRPVRQPGEVRRVGGHGAGKIQSSRAATQLGKCTCCSDLQKQDFVCSQLSINVNVVIIFLLHRRFLYSHKISGIHAVVEKMRPTSTLESISRTARYCVLSS